MKYFCALVFALLTSSALAGTSNGYGMGGQFRASIRSWQSTTAPVSYSASRATANLPARCFSASKTSACSRARGCYFMPGMIDSAISSTKWTNHMLAAYKPALRQYLVSNHYMDTLAFHTISGRELIDKFGYKACP